MKSFDPIAWWRQRASQRESRDGFGAAEELYALLDEASKVSAT